MNKTFATYLTILIAKDLQNGKQELPSYIYEVLEGYFIAGQFDKIENFLNEWLREKEIKGGNNESINR